MVKLIPVTTTKQLEKDDLVAIRSAFSKDFTLRRTMMVDGDVLILGDIMQEWVDPRLNFQDLLRDSAVFKVQEIKG